MTEPEFLPLGERIGEQIRRGVEEAIKNLGADSSPLGEAFGGPAREQSIDPADLTWEAAKMPTSITKIGSTVWMSTEMAMDNGLIPDTREPVKLSRWWRARWRIREAVASARLKVGEKIAGVKLDDRDDW